VRFSGKSYDPETLALLTEAFDAAWCEVETGYLGRPYSLAIQRKLMALRIMEEADYGERDPQYLKLCALRAIGARAIPPLRGALSRAASPRW
jgi:hypothetical protein